MIVSRMKLEFSDGAWSIANRTGKETKGLLERVAVAEKAEPKPAATLERMTLSELLYHALMGDGMQAV